MRTNLLVVTSFAQKGYLNWNQFPHDVRRGFKLPVVVSISPLGSCEKGTKTGVSWRCCTL